MATVLLVEDDPAVRSALGRLFAHLGHRLLQTGDAVEAYAALQKHRVSIAFVDMNLPVVSGLAILRRIRTTYPEVALVAMSGVAEALDGAMEELGEAYVLVKPFTIEDVGAIMRLAGS